MPRDFHGDIVIDIKPGIAMKEKHTKSDVMKKEFEDQIKTSNRKYVSGGALRENSEGSNL